MFDHRPLPLPTGALPGTAEKLRVFRARFLAGEQLFNDADLSLADLEALDAVGLLARHKGAGRSGAAVRGLRCCRGRG